MQTLDVFVPPRVSNASSPHSWMLVKWLVSKGEFVYRGQQIALLRCMRTSAVEYIMAPHAGRLIRISVEDGVLLSDSSLIVAAVEYCPHSVVFRGLCALCGADVDAAHFAEDVKAIDTSISVGYDQKFLTVSRIVAESTSASTANTLLKARRLALVLDLDHTLVHATADPYVSTILNNSPSGVNLNSVFSIIPNERPLRSFMSPMFIKLRPGLSEFLARVASKFQLHIYTMGSRPYADHVANLIDPGKRLFHGRVTSREDFKEGAWNRKSLERLFPCDDSLAVIVDDREDVWISENGPKFMPNLVRAQPYFFWDGLHEIYDSTAAVHSPLIHHQGRIRSFPHSTKVQSTLHLDNPAVGLSLRENIDPEAYQKAVNLLYNSKIRRRAGRRRRAKSGFSTDSGPCTSNDCDSREGQDLLKPDQNNTIANGEGKDSLCDKNANNFRVEQARKETAADDNKGSYPHENNLIGVERLNEDLKIGSARDDTNRNQPEQNYGDKTPIVYTKSRNNIPNHHSPQKSDYIKTEIASDASDRALQKLDRVQGVGSAEPESSTKDINSLSHPSPLMNNLSEAETKSSSSDGNNSVPVMNGNRVNVSVGDKLSEVRKTAEEMWAKDSSEETRQYLIRLAEILEECHRRFFEPKVMSSEASVENDKKEFGAHLTTADVKIILSDMRAEVLRGCTITFTGVVPLGVDPEIVPLWNLAKRLGAECLTEFNKGETTHMVVAENLKASTQKCEEAFKSGCTFVVTTKWLEASAINFQRRAEFFYRIAENETKFNTQAEYKSTIEANFTKERHLSRAQRVERRPINEDERFAKKPRHDNALGSDAKEHLGINEQRSNSADDTNANESNGELSGDELEAAMVAAFDDEDED